jgi:hypothetical protein
LRLPKGCRALASVVVMFSVESEGTGETREFGPSYYCARCANPVLLGIGALPGLTAISAVQVGK